MNVSVHVQAHCYPEVQMFTKLRALYAHNGHIRYKARNTAGMGSNLILPKSCWGETLLTVPEPYSI